MNFSEAMQMLGTKLQGKYGHLGFKYKKSDKTLTRHSKNFTYMIAFSSFGWNTKDSISIEVCYIINTRPYDPYGYAKPDINTQLLGSGEINHSGSGENRQFWSNENHQSGVASPQVVLFTRPAAGQPVSQ